MAAKGVHVAIVRLPQVHGTRRQGLVSMLLQTARAKGVAACVGDGSNRWSAAPLVDVKHLYRLAVERKGPGITTYHAVQEEGVALRDIAKTLGKRLSVPVASIPAQDALNHFGPFLRQVAALDLPASSEWTRKTLGWQPTGPGLLDNLTK